jgi:hypothetical protein
MDAKLTIPTLPPPNWNSQLQKACDASAVTVTKAIIYNARGRKAELVRQKFTELWPQCCVRTAEASN